MKGGGGEDGRKGDRKLNLLLFPFLLLLLLLLPLLLPLRYAEKVKEKRRRRNEREIFFCSYCSGRRIQLDSLFFTKRILAKGATHVESFFLLPTAERSPNRK